MAIIFRPRNLNLVPNICSRRGKVDLELIGKGPKVGPDSISISRRGRRVDLSTF